MIVKKQQPWCFFRIPLLFFSTATWFFLGVNAQAWRLSIDWQEGNSTGKTKTWTLQPTAEMGYMFLINDMFFISPTISSGIQSNFKKKARK